jgi:hypothetical protein
MDKYSRIEGGRSIWSDRSKASEIINNEFFPTIELPKIYATWNPNHRHSSVALSGGNLISQGVRFNEGGVRATIGKNSGKWYWEIKLTTLGTGGILDLGLGSRLGIALIQEPVGVSLLGSSSLSWGIGNYDGAVFNPFNISYNNQNQIGLNVTIGFALDMDAGTLKYYIAGVDKGIAHTGITGVVFPVWAYSDCTSQFTANFGATAFDYPVPSGFNAGLYNIEPLVTTSRFFQFFM